MSNTDQNRQVKFENAGVYRIVVQGTVPQNYASRLGGMEITERGEDSTADVTILVGRVMDQSELTGVLATLYELHLSLVSVELLTDK